jgi:hypothetical protein
MRAGFREARAAAAGLPVGAFPAALPATVAQASPTASGLEKRTRLAWASLTGRI